MGFCVILCLLLFSTLMANFLGECEVAIDAKGRFLLPSGFRKQLAEGNGGKFVINRGIENCLTIYTEDVWEEVSGKVNKLNDFKASVRKFKRLFLNGATRVELDSADRMLLPKNLLEYAGIKKDAVFSPQGNKVELWDKDTYYKYIQENSGSYSDLADDVAEDFGTPLDKI